MTVGNTRSTCPGAVFSFLQSEAPGTADHPCAILDKRVALSRRSKGIGTLSTSARA
jgi:hypothetical protein